MIGIKKELGGKAEISEWEQELIIKIDKLVKGKHLFIISVYNNNSIVNTIAELKNLIETGREEESEIIIAGDFNARIRKGNKIEN